MKGFLNYWDKGNPSYSTKYMVLKRIFSAAVKIFVNRHLYIFVLWVLFSFLIFRFLFYSFKWCQRVYSRFIAQLLSEIALAICIEYILIKVILYNYECFFAGLGENDFATLAHEFPPFAHKMPVLRTRVLLGYSDSSRWDHVLNGHDQMPDGSAIMALGGVVGSYQADSGFYELVIGVYASVWWAIC